jgi:hypothetical protein
MARTKKSEKNEAIKDAWSIENLAPEEYLRQLLMSDEGCTPIEQALKEADEKWPEKLEKY